MPGQPPNPSLVGSTMQNRDSSSPVAYQITDWLRSTGVVDTYLAAHVGMAIKIELKQINPAFTSLTGFADRFARHIKVLVTLNVGSVIKVYDYGTDNNRYFIVVEYHKSPSLRARLENETRLPLTAAVDYIRQMSETLDQAARAGVLHGLLSPEAITLTSKRGALIGDIGLASIFGDSLARVLAKTPQISAYAAPELVMGQALTASHDLYALTSLLYEMTTGQVPFPNTTPFQVGALPPPNPANLDRALAPLTAFMQRGLAKDPAERFNSYNDFEAALRDVLGPPAPVSRIPTPPPAVAPKTELVKDDFAGQTMSEVPAFKTPPPAVAPKTELVKDDFAGQTMADMPAFKTPPPAVRTSPPAVTVQKPPAADDFAGQTMADMPAFKTPPPAVRTAPPAVTVQKPPAAAADDFAGQTMSDMPAFKTPPPAVRTSPPPAVTVQKPPAAAADDFAGQTMSDMPAFKTPPPAVAVQKPAAADDSAGRTVADMPAVVPPPSAPRPPTPSPAAANKPIAVIQPPAPGRPPPSSSNVSLPPAVAAKAAAKRADPSPSAAPATPAAPAASAPVRKQAPVTSPQKAEANFSARTMLEVPGLQQAGAPPVVPPSFNTAPPAAQSHQNTPRQLEERYRTDRIDEPSAPNGPNAPYSMPTMPPSGSSIPPQSAVPYNFGSVPPSYPGGQVTTPRQLDQRYGTSVMNRADIDRGGGPSSGVTGFINANERDKALGKSKRKTSPIVLIIVLIIVLLLAAAIGFVLLKAAGVIG